MKRPNAVLKLAAVASSAVLVAGFVSYRAGAFDWVRSTNPPAVGPGPGTEGNSPDGTAPQSPDPVVTNVMLSGSKSGIYVVPPGATASGGSTAGASPPIMPGSKSIAPLIPPAPSPPAQAANPPK